MTWPRSLSSPTASATAILDRFTGPHKVRAGESLGDLKTTLCPADNTGQGRDAHVCGLWGLADPTSTHCITVEEALLFSGGKWKSPYFKQ